MRNDELIAKIDDGLTLFRDLGKFRKPDYDTPLALTNYAAWYQPIQIMLAYVVFKHIIVTMQRGCKFSEDAKLRVVDFGCGQLATPIGLAIALGDEAEQGRRVPPVEICLIDESAKMIDFGKEIWHNWHDSILQNPSLSCLMSAYALIDLIDRSATSVSIPPPDATETWLMAMHVVYDDDSNNLAISRELSAWTSQFKPNVGVITHHHGHSDRRIGTISPFICHTYHTCRVSESSLCKVVDWSEIESNKLIKLQWYWDWMNRYGDDLKYKHLIRMSSSAWWRSKFDATARFSVRNEGS